MKTWALIAVGILAATPVFAQYGGYGTGSNPNSHQNSGYTRQNGTYVQPYYQTNPNSTQYDNYSTRGNYNPHNGSYGTRTPKY
jgi:hypothetical protein